MSVDETNIENLKPNNQNDKNTTFIVKNTVTFVSRWNDYLPNLYLKTWEKLNILAAI